MSNEPRSVTVLGSTGSVGRQTIDLLLAAPGHYRVSALVANRNAALLAEQAIALGAEHAVVCDPSAYGDLKSALAGHPVTAAAGPEAVVEAAERQADWTMAAITGAAGLGRHPHRDPSWKVRGPGEQGGTRLCWRRDAARRR